MKLIKGLNIEQISDACDIAYKEAADNAYFGNGFIRGIKYAVNATQANQMLELLEEINECLSQENEIEYYKEKINNLIKNIT